MSYSLCVSLDWQGSSDRERLFSAVRAADDAGAHSVWVAEAWGRDAFSLMVQLAERTKQIRIGSGIINIFSRSPAALAQQFATLDEISEGRTIIGLGTSGANVIEQFHGVPFARPLRRMREYIEVINILLSGRPLNYTGKIFRLERGFRLGVPLVREHIPIYVASLAPRSVRQTAELADGWLPIWTPLEALPSMVSSFREQAASAGRDPASLTVRSPGSITITRAVEARRRAAAGNFAFYVARMGKFYYEHVTRLGYGKEADAIRKVWEERGSGAAAEVVSPELQQSLTFVTDSVEAARERLEQQAAAGVDLHSVVVDSESPAEIEQTLLALAG